MLSSSWVVCVKPGQAPRIKRVSNNTNRQIFFTRILHLEISVFTTHRVALGRTIQDLIPLGKQTFNSCGPLVRYCATLLDCETNLLVRREELNSSHSMSIRKVLSKDCAV